MRAKTVNESRDEYGESFPLKTVEWGDIDDGSHYQKIEFDAMADQLIHNEKEFNKWKDDFVRKYGGEGELTYIKSAYSGPEYWGVIGNSKFDEFKKEQGKGVSDFYATGGRYKGD